MIQNAYFSRILPMLDVHIFKTSTCHEDVTFFFLFFHQFGQKSGQNAKINSIPRKYALQIVTQPVFKKFVKSMCVIYALDSTKSLSTLTSSIFDLKVEYESPLLHNFQRIKKMQKKMPLSFFFHLFEEGHFKIN